MDLQLATISHAPLSAGVAVLRDPIRLSGVTLRHLRGPDAIATVLHLREEIDLSVHAAAGPQFQAVEKKRDECGCIVAFELDGELIGTIRIVPLGLQLTLTETLLPQLGADAPAVLPGDWEVGRLVLAPEFRSDVDALRHCLSLAIDFACSNTRVERLYGTCTHALSRLYRRFGFTAFAREVPLPGTGKAYTLIRGASRDVAAALGAGGGGVPRTQ